MFTVRRVIQRYQACYKASYHAMPFIRPDRQASVRFMSSRLGGMEHLDDLMKQMNKKLDS